MLKAVMQACLSLGEKLYSVAQAAEAAGMERKEIRHRLWKLEAAGFIIRSHSQGMRTETGQFVKEIYYRNTSLLAKRFQERTERRSPKASGWDKMWQALRVLRRFTRSDLAQICDQSMANVIYFTKAYRQAGYLRCLGKGGSRNVMWTLVKDPGPKRPPYKVDGDVD